MSHSTKRGSSRKPAKSDFPLTKHPTGRWCKKVKGRLCYFGKIADDPDGKAALDLWLQQRDDLLAGRRPRTSYKGLTLEELCNRFLHFKRQRVDSGELAERTWKRYQCTCEFLLSVWSRSWPVESLGPEDFQTLRAKMGKRWGPVAVANEIQTTRSLFGFGYEMEFLEKPVRFGPAFTKPNAETMRRTRTAKGDRTFDPSEVLALLDVASPNLRAMILLGLNGGLGNTDLAMLPRTAINLETGWLLYPRPKTGVMRRIPLWPETLQAVRDVLASRPEPSEAEDASLLFVGRRGKNYVGNHRGYRVTQEFKRARQRAGLQDRCFYDLRRTFQTVAEASHDLPAVQSIMGHAAAESDMSSRYRQRVEDERLRAVVDCVREWLFDDVVEEHTDDDDEPAVLPFVGKKA